MFKILLVPSDEETIQWPGAPKLQEAGGSEITSLVEQENSSFRVHTTGTSPSQMAFLRVGL